MRRHSMSADGASWVTCWYAIEGEPAAAEQAIGTGTLRPIREESFVTTADRSVALATEINRQENIEVEFVPPLVVMPEGLMPSDGAPAEFTQDLSMTVHPLGDHVRVTNRGPAHSVIRYIGDQRIETGAGVMNAKMITTTFTADLGALKVDRRSSLWFAEGVGLVMEQSHEKTTALGFPIRTLVEDWRLVGFTR